MSVCNNIEVNYDTKETIVECLKARLLLACQNLAYQIEETKRVTTPMGGVCSVLDEISGVALTVAGITRNALA